MMENLMLNLSLEEIMIRKIVIHLWNVHASCDLFLLEKFRLSRNPSRHVWLTDSRHAIKNSEEWQESLKKVKVKVTELCLPAPLEKKMLLVVKPIGVEMLDGKLTLIAENLSDSCRDVDLQILKQLSWTYAGELDYQKTVENLLHYETLDAVKRFRLACSTLLVDHIPDLWEALPEKYQTYFDDELALFSDKITHSEYYWYRTVKCKQWGMNRSCHEVVFETLARQANKTGTKHAFQKLSKVERDSCLCSTVCDMLRQRFTFSSLDFFPKKSFSGILFYLLPEMNREELEEVLKNYPCQILACFLDWPFQDFLPDIADVVWPYIPESKYEDLWNMMDKSFRSSGYYFPDAFQKFFLRSPTTFRKFFLKHDDTFLPEFLSTKDADTIEVILRSLDAAYRVELISNKPCFYDIFNKLLMDDDCNFVKLCLRLALESDDDKERVKWTFLNHIKFSGFFMDDITYSVTYKVQKEKWKEVFESLQEDDASVSNKRSLRDRASARIKKSRTEERRQQRN